MNYSFSPDGKWFVFDAVTGRTLSTGFPTKRHAVNYIHMNKGWV